ncbi:MAG: TIGR02466 family protein [Paracoccaceae bacterium]
MAQIDSLFVTRLYRAALAELGKAPDPEELEDACLSIAEDDEAGQDWCHENGYAGYTSYASLADLPWRFPIFKDLVKLIDKHVAAFAKDLDFDLGGRKIKLDSLWINILPQGGVHSSHIHPHSVISGTTYVTMPTGASAIKYEDPRLAMMMAAPPRRKEARAEMRSFVYLAPAPGEILLWESWLRHEVPVNMAEDDRISISFNYGWG